MNNTSIRNFFFFSAFFLSVFFSNPQIYAQDVPPAVEAKAREELKKRGLGGQEDQVQQKLIERGFDLDNLQPSQVPALEKAMEEITRELQGEGAAAAEEQPEAQPIPEPPVEVQIEKAEEEQDVELTPSEEEEVKKVVEEEGKAVDQAVAELIIDEGKEDLPPGPVYGQQIFREGLLKVFTKSEDIRPPDSYVLGTGDRINISIFGLSQEEASFEINKAGYITPTAMPRISLRGVTLGKAKNLLQSRYAQYYRFRPEDFQVSITYARTIVINLFGELSSPGSYTIPATNTAFNAIMAGGGPSDEGSVRNIKLIRAGETKVIDVYEYMVNPGVRENFYLQENDIIFIPFAEKVVEITGAVRRPFKYELRENEDLLSLIEFAGGLKPDAYIESVQIKRFNRNDRSVIDVDLNELIDNEKDFDLFPEDVVTIRSIPRPFKNYVEVAGAVEVPDKFELTSGMQISDLIEKSILHEAARTDIAFLTRTNIDNTVNYQRINLDSILSNPNSASNIVLKPKDRLFVLSKLSFLDENGKISISGAIRSPLFLPYDPNEKLKVADVVLMSAGLTPEAADVAYVERTDPTDKDNKSYLRFNVRTALRDSASADNITLKPFDKIVIFTKTEFTDKATLDITGEVRKPKSLAFAENLRVRDMVYLAIGLTPQAADIGYIKRTDPATENVSYIRFNVQNALRDSTSDDNILLEPFDQVILYNKNSFSEDATVSTDGAIRAPGIFSYDPNLRISDIIYLSSGLTNEATNFGYITRRDVSNPKYLEYVRVDVRSAIENPGSEADINLGPFDRLTVYSKSTFTDEFTVSIRGEVRQPGEYKYDKSLRLKDVLTFAGGLKLQAAKNRIEISRLTFEDNQRTRTVLAVVAVDDSLNVIGGQDEIFLQPFDQVIVRTIPDFELPKNVVLEGEVMYPGTYPLMNDNERLLNVIKRAGGLTLEAFPEGATLKRSQDETGFVIIRMDKIMNNRKNRSNIILKEGDIIYVPKRKDLVAIEVANTLASELYPDKIAGSKQINVPYHRGKRAKYYVKEYMAGLGERGRNRLITVEQPNGELDRTKNFVFFKIYPKVDKGAIVSVGAKPVKVVEETGQDTEEKEPVNWGETLTNTVAQVTTVLTLILLFERINN